MKRRQIRLLIPSKMTCSKMLIWRKKSPPKRRRRKRTRSRGIPLSNMESESVTSSKSREMWSACCVCCQALRWYRWSSWANTMGWAILVTVFQPMQSSRSVIWASIQAFAPGKCSTQMILRPKTSSSCISAKEPRRYLKFTALESS